MLCRLKFSVDAYARAMIVTNADVVDTNVRIFKCEVPHAQATSGEFSSGKFRTIPNPEFNSIVDLKLESL